MDTAAVQKLLIDKKLNVTDLAKKINVNRSHLSQVIHGHRKGSVTWPKIFKALDIKFKEAA